MKQYILIAQENIHHNIQELQFESDISLNKLLEDNSIRLLLVENGIVDEDEDWKHRKEDYGFNLIEVNHKQAITSQSEYDYSYQFIIQEDEKTQQQKDNLELYIRKL